MAFDWIGFAGMIVTLTTGFVVGVIANAIIWIVIPGGEYLIKGLHFGVFALILLGTLGLPLMFVIISPVTGLVVFGGILAMTVYVLYMTYDMLF